MAIWKEIPPKGKHPDYALSLNNLGGLYKSMGRYEEAEPLYKEAIAIFKGTSPEGKASLLCRKPQQSCGIVCSPWGGTEKRNRSIRRQWRYGRNFPRRGSILIMRKASTILRDCMNLWGGTEKRSRSYKEAMAIVKELLPKGKHPDYALSLNNLAGLYESMGRYEEAEPLYKEAMAIFKELLPKGKHPSLCHKPQQSCGVV